MPRPMGVRIVTLLAAVLPLTTSTEAADNRAFTKIADQGTAIPSGTGAFTTLTNPQTSLGYIYFGGNGAGGQRGVYRFDRATSTVTPIVDGSTILPPAVGGFPPGNWPDHSQLRPTMTDGMFAVYGPDVSFRGFYSLFFDSMLFSTRGGIHVVLKDQSDPTHFPPDAVSMDDQRYLASKMTLPYVWAGPGSPPNITTFVKINGDGTSQVEPTNENILHFLQRDGAARFSTYRRNAGTRGALTLNSSAGTFDFSDGSIFGGVLDPRFGGPFAFYLPGETSGYTLAGPSVLFSDDGHTVVLRASASANGTSRDRTALLTKVAGGPLQVVADTNTIVPTLDGVQTFADFTAVAIDGDIVTFIGAPASGPAGIFAASGGTLAEVVSVGDTLDGKTITGLTFSDDRPLSGNDLVFTASFSDGTSGLYLTSVPEPSAAVLLTMTLPLLVRRRRNG